MKFAVLIASVLFLHAAAAAQADPNFSGEWILDAARSDFGGSNLVERTQKVTQTATDFRIERNETVRVSAASNKTTAYTTTWSFGKVVRQPLLGGPEIGEIGIRFHSVPRLTQLLVTAMIGTKVVMSEGWSISDDGNEIYVTESFPLANRRRYLVYYRKGTQPKPPAPKS